jgi:LruC domain-containing protein
MVRYPGHTASLVEVWNVESFTDELPYRIDTRENVPDYARVVVFPHTKQAFTRQGDRVTIDNGRPGDPVSMGHTAGFVIEFDPPLNTKNTLDGPPYDPYLFVHNTGYDVHLLGKSPLPGSNNPIGKAGFRDENDYPRALLVPHEWAHPIEVNHIENAYPSFNLWRRSKGQQNASWYMYPVDGEVVPPTYSAP